MRITCGHFLAIGVPEADPRGWEVARRKQNTAPETGDLFAPRERVLENVEEVRPDLEPTAVVPSAKTSDPPAPVRPVLPSKRESLYFDEPFREFEHNGGVHLTDSILWCDADRRHDLCFISHAHADYIGKNRRILATDKTVRILTRGTGKIDSLTSPYRRSFTLGPLELEMHPAGHILGSAQLLIQREGRRIVYTSDVNPRPSATAQRGQPIPCDVLAIPATYGLPMFRFPPREEVEAQILAFVHSCLEDKATPVLIANQVGTAQELMHVLGKAGLRQRVHRSIYDVAKVYKELGINLPGARRFQGSPAKDEVVIFPPILRRHASIRKLRKFKTALITGRAVDEAFVYRHRVDAAFALSDSADHADLISFIRETGAGAVYLVGGYVEELGAELRNLGFKVLSLIPPEQLSLF